MGSESLKVLEKSLKFLFKKGLKEGSKYNCREHLLKKSERFCVEAMSIVMVMK